MRLSQNQIARDKIAVVVLHYGNAELTRVCLASLSEAHRAGARIFVVCNSSEQEAASVAQDVADLWGDDASSFVGIPEEVLMFPEVTGQFGGNVQEELKQALRSNCVVIATNRNSGFAAGNNVGGFAALLDSSVEWVWFLNNDTVLEAGSYRAMQRATLQNPNGILGATVVDMDRPERVQCAGGYSYNPYFTTTTPYLHGKARDTLPTAATVQLDYVFGASMCIPAQAFRDVGGFCEKYFLYYEEIDFCRSVARNGYSPVWVPDVVVRHEGGGATESVGENRIKRDFVQYHENLSTFIFTRRHHKMLVPLVLAVRIAAKLPLFAIRGELYLVKSLWRAVRDFLRPA
ncbi:MAG: glycosyltransferase family 2 protein [Desulfovibrio sp.]